MWRLLRQQKKLLSFGAKANRTQYPQPQVLRVQHVKFRRRWFKPSNWFMAFAVYYTCWSIYDQVVFDTLSNGMTKVLQDSGVDVDELEKEEDSEPILFLPFPGFTEMVESRPYKGFEPEWQAFIEISRDAKLVKSIRNSLAQIVLAATQADPRTAQSFGPALEVDKYWLDIRYPSKPPPTFVRKGIAIDDDAVYWTSRPVDSIDVLRTRRVLWPDVMASSLLSFSGALIKQNALGIARMFGYESNNKTDSAPPLHPLERLSRIGKPSMGQSSPQSPPSLPHAKGQAADGTTTHPMSAVDKPSGSNSSSDSAHDQDREERLFPDLPRPQDLQPIKDTQEHIREPLQALKQTFAKEWRPLRSHPARGSIYVSGLVQLRGGKASLTIDAHGWWDPKTKEFDRRTITLILRNVSLRRQPPAA